MKLVCTSDLLPLVVQQIVILRSFLISTLVGPIHPYTTVTGFLFCICFSEFWEVIFECLRHEKWSVMMTCLAVKNFTLINITTKGERLTFHFYCCGKIVHSCSNSYYWYFLSQLEEGVEILLFKIFFWTHILCLQYEQTGIMHVYALCSWAIFLYYMFF